MDAQQFCYWMQGFCELSGDNMPTPEQWKSIREHLQTVFKKVTPPVGGGGPAWPQDYLRQLQDARKEWDKNQPPYPFPPSGPSLLAPSYTDQSKTTHMIQC